MTFAVRFLCVLGQRLVKPPKAEHAVNGSEWVLKKKNHKISSETTLKQNEIEA